MEYIPIIIGVLAFLVAGFTFYKTSGLLERVRVLEKKNRELEAGLKGLERNRQTNQNQGRENNRPAKGNQQPAPPQQSRNSQQPQQEPRQKQQGQHQGRGQQQEPRANQGQPQPQRQPQEPKQKQEPQPPQQRQPREPRQPQEPRQKGPQQPQPQQPQGGAGNQQGQPREPRQPQQPRRNENRRREPMIPGEAEQNPALPPVVSPTLGTGLVGDDLLSELTQPEAVVRQPEAPVSRTRFSIIPEDGIIKSHQLQQRPDSDSYLEIDAPEEGSITTSYRFNLSGNQAFVISQGMDRLENAFSFEKPSNRMVSRIILLGDGVLTRTSAGWKIQEKARIDFR